MERVSFGTVFDTGIGNVEFFDDILDEMAEKRGEMIADVPEISEILGKLSAKDSLIRSINQFGKVDLAYMAQISGMNPIDLVDELERIQVLFADPDVYDAGNIMNTEYLLSSVYAQGNLYDRIESAERANREYPGRFDRNIVFLKEKMPPKLRAEEIEFTLGSNFIPAYFYIGFVQQLLQMPVAPNIKYNDCLDRWIADIPEKVVNRVCNEVRYGTVKMPAVRLIMKLMNSEIIEVKEPKGVSGSGKYQYEVDEVETAMAQDKASMIISEFRKWILSDAKRKKRIAEIYYEKFCGCVVRYDGAFLEFPEMNPDVRLYRNQKDAILRIILNPTTLVSHSVGTGKTYTVAAAAHACVRTYGLCNKAMIVVPNAVFDAWMEAYHYLYPEDTILGICPTNFRVHQRQRMIGRIKEGEYQVCIICGSCFDMIGMSQGHYVREMERKICEIVHEINKAENRREKQALQTEEKKLRKKMGKIKEKYEDSEMNCFEELGIDYLAIDESHQYKNISFRYSGAGNVVGMHARGSKKCDSLLEKVHYVSEQGGKVVFATGTPLTNSLADLYVQMLYLQPEILRAYDIDDFSMWLQTFASQEQQFEVDVDAVHARMKKRFTSFSNLPELMNTFSQVTSFYQSDGADMQLPEFRGYTDIVVPKNPLQERFIQHLAERTEDIRRGLVDKTEDNLLKITVEGRQVALSLHLVMEDSEIDKLAGYEGAAETIDREGKIYECARQVYRIYLEHPGRTQVVFCDIGTPKEEYNVYDRLKGYLVEMGMQDSDVRFIHDADKEKVREKTLKELDEGKIPVMIGSTLRLGTGVNVQKNLFALHHLDIPWRPADLTQREGRIIRHGNQNGEVQIYRYICEGSFDAYSWQLLESKAKFLSKFMAASMDPSEREAKDLSDMVLDYAEIKALAIGNPLIKERIRCGNELSRLRSGQAERRRQLLECQSMLGRLPEQMEHLKELIGLCERDMRFYQEHKCAIPKEDRWSKGNTALRLLSGNIGKIIERKAGSYQGFDIVLPAGMTADRPYLILSREKGGSYRIQMKGADAQTALGVTYAFDYMLNHLADRMEEQKARLQQLAGQEKEARNELKKGNEYDALVDAKRKEIEEIDKKLEIGKEN